MGYRDWAVGAIQAGGADAETIRPVAGRRRRGRQYARAAGASEEIVFTTNAPERRRFMSRTLAVGLLLFGGLASASAQPPNARIGEAVPRDVRELYDKGLQFLVKTQTENGDWTGGQSGPGITGLGLMT